MPRTIIFTAGVLCRGGGAPFAPRTAPAGRRRGFSAAGRTPLSPGERRRRPSARPVTPGRLPRDALQNLGVDVEVGVDRVDVVLLLERVDEAQEPAGALLVERYAGLGLLGHLGGLDLDPRLLERLAHGGEVGRLAHDLVDVVVEGDVLRAGVDGHHQVILGVALGVDDDEPLLVEQVGDRARLAEAPSALGEDMADLGARAVAVVGHGLDEERDTARPVALVDDRLERVGVGALTRALGDRALDVVLGHRGVAGLLDGEREPGVALDVSPALLRGHGDRAGELREELAAARVDDRLLVLDPRPFRVTGHGVRGYLRRVSSPRGRSTSAAAAPPSPPGRRAAPRGPRRRAASRGARA